MAPAPAAVKPKEATKPREPQAKAWNVILLNDEEHTYDYVIEMMGVIFAHPKEKGFKIAETVDTEGRAICLTTHKEHAELKRDQIHAYGKDPRMAVSKGSMSAVIEPVPE